MEFGCGCCWSEMEEELEKKEETMEGKSENYF
jgi:hypothetical protein